MRARIQQVEVNMFREDDGSYAVACSALGIYTVGKTAVEAKANFQKALDLHLAAIRGNAIKALAHKSLSRHGCYA